MVIWKYAIEPGVSPCDPIYIDMPVDAQVLSVQTQPGDVIMLWARVIHADTVTRQRCFYAIPTGYEFDDTNCRYLATVQIFEGAIVIHIFEGGAS